MKNESGNQGESRMQFLLLGVSDAFGLTDQRFFEDLPEAEREARAMETQRLQPYLFRLTRVPVVPEVSDQHFWPLCYCCGRPVNPRVGWVRYDDGRVYHAGCDEQ